MRIERLSCQIRRVKNATGNSLSAAAWAKLRHISVADAREFVEGGAALGASLGELGVAAFLWLSAHGDRLGYANEQHRAHRHKPQRTIP